VADAVLLSKFFDSLARLERLVNRPTEDPRQICMTCKFLSPNDPDYGGKDYCRAIGDVLDPKRLEDVCGMWEFWHKQRKKNLIRKGTW
jgi:hypothetical protein